MSLPIEPLLPEPVNSIVIMLADEGVPVSAIARSVKVPSDEVRDVLHEALATGRLVEMPRSDWPPHMRRADRMPSTGLDINDDQLLAHCRRLFKLTQLEATVFIPLLKRDEASKQALHGAIEAGRAARAAASADETDPKMVDVVVHKLRRKLRPHAIEIKTLWAKGYFMERPMRRLVYDKITAYLSGQVTISTETTAGNGEEPEIS